MDVTCERCDTRYEFDEALVSTRGTTVKCTTCGHQFKIFREGGSADMDGWTVRTVDGRILHFKAMRQLQSAIAGGKVTIEDVLVPHDGTEPRRLGRIDELQSFFTNSDDVTNVRRGSWLPPKRQRTGQTLRPGPASAPEQPTQPRMRRVEAPGSQHESLADRDGNPLPARSGDTKRPAAGTAEDVMIPGAPSLPRIPSTVVTLAEDEAPTARKRVATLPPPAVPPPAMPPRRKGEQDAPVDTLPRGHRDLAKAAKARPRPVKEPGTLPSATAQRDAALRVGEALRARRSRQLDEEKTRARSTSQQNAGDSQLSVADTIAIEEADVDVEIESADRAIEEAVTAAKQPMPRRRTTSTPAAREPMPSEHPVETPVSSQPTTSAPSVARPSVLFRGADEGPRYSDYPVSQQRSGWLRWGIGLLLLGLLGVGGFALMKQLQGNTVATTSSAATEDDKRVSGFLKKGEERLADGDLEGAKEQYVKASGVAEADPRVAAALANIEIIRADMAWLQLRLLPSDDSQRSNVALRVRRAAQRAQQALGSLGNSSKGNDDKDASTALRMDLLRIEGKPAEARKLAGRLPTSGAEAGRVLAVLDLSEADPTFASIFDRLRTAARGEHKKLGRAQAALVYALALAGERDEAEQELSNLKAQNEHHELLPALAAFVKKAKQKKDDPKEAASSTPAKGPAEGVPRDFREALKQGHSARARGDLDGAEHLYRVALHADPGNTEAMAGLADVARDRGDTGSAAKRYEDMLKDNPNYIPGLVGLADVKWASGDKAGAVKLYQEVAQTAPGSSYASQANRRIGEYQKEQAAKPEPQPSPDPQPSPEPQPSATPPPSPDPQTTPEPQPTSEPTATAAPEPQPPAPEPAPPPPSPEPTGIDTTDLDP